jgi:hemoglobin
MRDSHQHLNITLEEWAAFTDDFRQTLDKFKVPAAEEAELSAIVGSTHGEMVTDRG